MEVECGTIGQLLDCKAGERCQCPTSRHETWNPPSTHPTQPLWLQLNYLFSMVIWLCFWSYSWIHGSFGTSPQQSTLLPKRFQLSHELWLNSASAKYIRTGHTTGQDRDIYVQQGEEIAHHFGYDISNIGVRSSRKCSSTHMDSGPSAAATYILTGHTMGQVRDIYVQQERAGHAYAGRILAGLPVNSPQWEELRADVVELSALRLFLMPPPAIKNLKRQLRQQQNNWVLMYYIL
jgi:hypothetical protein